MRFLTKLEQRVIAIPVPDDIHFPLKLERERDRDLRAGERAGPELLDGAALPFPPAACTVVITFNFLLTVFDTKDNSNLTGSPKCLYPLYLAPLFYEQKNTNTKL